MVLKVTGFSSMSHSGFAGAEADLGQRHVWRHQRVLTNRRDIRRCVSSPSLPVCEWRLRVAPY